MAGDCIQSLPDCCELKNAMRMLDCVWLAARRVDSPSASKCRNSMRKLVIVFGVWECNHQTIRGKSVWVWRGGAVGGPGGYGSEPGACGNIPPRMCTHMPELLSGNKVFYILTVFRILKYFKYLHGLEPSQLV